MNDVVVAIRKLSKEKQKELYDYTMDLGPFDDYELTEEFSEKLKKYISTGVLGEAQYRKRTQSIINTFILLGYSQDQMLRLFCGDIGLLVADANTVFKNILLFGKIQDSKGKQYRDEAIFKKPEDLRISPQRTYSRIRFLESDEGMRYRRKKGPVTRKNALTQSESEFKKQFHVDNNSLASRYPLDWNAYDKILRWDENKEFIIGLKKRGMKL